MEEGTENQLMHLNILIAEDDEISKMLIRLAVNSISRKISIAKNGLEAVEYCRLNPDVDLVIMDIKMPKMDGYEASTKIRQFNPTVVIIAQTAYSLTDDREKAIAAGCSDYIAKPINKKDLILMIRKHIKQS